jgi:hypothetical protein
LAAAVGLRISGIGKGHKSAVPYPCGLDPCRAAKTPIPLRGYEGAYLAADPKAPNHVVVADTDLVAAKCGWHTTFDNGKTWIDGYFTLPSGFTGCHINAPSGGHVPSGSVGFGTFGQVYAVFGSARAADAGRESVLVAQSIDGGRTFLPAAVAQSPPDGYGYGRPLMTVGRGPTGKDVLLLSFWACHRTSQGTACDQALFSRSDDAGTTYGTPVQVSVPPPGQTPPAITAGQNPSQTVAGPDGTLYETFQQRFADNHVDLFLAKSADGGATWTQSKIDTENGLGKEFDPAKLAIDPKNGALYTAWSDSRTGTQQIFFRKSTDKGATWSQAKLLSPDEQRFSGNSRSPSISVAPDGRVDVAYYYTGPETPKLDDVWLDSTSDGGITFQIHQVNPKPIDRTLGYSGPATSLGLVGNHYPPNVFSLDNSADVVWSDTLHATSLTQTQDIEFRTITFGLAKT